MICPCLDISRRTYDPGLKFLLDGFFKKLANNFDCSFTLRGSFHFLRDFNLSARQTKNKLEIVFLIQIKNDFYLLLSNLLFALNLWWYQIYNALVRSWIDIYINISAFTFVRPYGVRPLSIRRVLSRPVQLLSFIIFRVLDAQSDCCWARQSRARYTWF